MCVTLLDRLQGDQARQPAACLIFKLLLACVGELLVVPQNTPWQVTMSPEKLAKLGERPAEVVLAHIVLSLQNKV